MKRQFFERKLNALGFAQQNGIYRRKGNPIRIQIIGNVAKVWNESRNFDGIGKANYFSFDRLANAGDFAEIGGLTPAQVNNSNSTRKEDGFDPYAAWGDVGSDYEYYYEGNGVWSVIIKGSKSNNGILIDSFPRGTEPDTTTSGDGVPETDGAGTDSAGVNTDTGMSTGTDTGAITGIGTNTGVWTGTSTGASAGSSNIDILDTGASVAGMIKKYWWVILVIILIFSQAKK
jgi:hypothetical protein